MRYRLHPQLTLALFSCKLTKRENFFLIAADIPSPIIKLYRNFIANVRGTRDMERLDGVPRERVSSRYCVKQAMDGLFVAKQLLYRVLNNN